MFYLDSSTESFRLSSSDDLYRLNSVGFLNKIDLVPNFGVKFITK